MSRSQSMTFRILDSCTTSLLRHKSKQVMWQYGPYFFSAFPKCHSIQIFPHPTFGNSNSGYGLIGWNFGCPAPFLSRGFIQRKLSNILLSSRTVPMSATASVEISLSPTPRIFSKVEVTVFSMSDLNSESKCRKPSYGNGNKSQ